MAQLLELDSKGNIVTALEVEIRAAGLVFNPGDPGWIDPDAPPEVQERQREERKAIKQKHLEEVHDQWQTHAV